MRVIIADDEQPARQRLNRLLSAFADIEVIAEAENGSTAVSLVQGENPEVVFLDIEMPVLNGLEAAATLRDSQTLIVFVTAFDQFALQAFDNNAADYLVKPVERVRLQQTVERLRRRLADRSAADGPAKDRLLADLHQGERLARLAVRSGSRIEIIPYAEISLIQAADGYAEIYFQERKLLCDESLDGLAQKLGPMFLRIHRSAVINLDFLSELVRAGDRKYSARLKDFFANEVPVARDQLKSLQARLGL
jgi:two-component system LytT family response regulator